MSEWKYASLLSLVIATLSGNAAAGDFYFRLGYGEAQIPDAGEFQYELYRYDRPPKSNVYNLDLGYEINRHISVDFRYANLSDFKGKKSADDNYGDGYLLWIGTIDQTSELELKSAGISVSVTTDSTRPYFAGLKLGYQYWDAQWDHQVHSYGTDYDIEFFSGDIIGETDYDVTWENTGSDSGFQENYGAIVGLNIASWQIGLEHMLYAIDEGDSGVTSLFVGKRF
ncbi:hypothetical protein [Microbulbifer sp. MCCC 1A16149]|uniref:hypothetical protein n=1 Tax=Microbulbifer sp. MCCC 1A16149 TaxID=3411322 RepID=UPI003D0B48A8